MPATTAAARRWAELLDLHDTSDLSTRAFAAQHGVNHSTLVTTVEAQGTPEELHLSVSLTTDVEPMRLAWAAGGPRHVALIARPQAGPGWTAVRDGAHATAMAEHLVGQLKALRSRHGALPVRLFLAGPQASCVALGRLLNAQGRWILMDKIGDAYAERVTITV